MRRRWPVAEQTSSPEDTTGMRTLAWLLTQIRVSRPRMAAVSALAVLATVGTLATPIILGAATNVIVDGTTGPVGAESGAMDWDLLWTLIVAAAAIYLISYVCTLTQGLLLPHPVHLSIAGLRAQVSELIPRVPIGFTESTKRGELMAKATTHIDNATTVLGPLFVSLPTNLLPAVFTTVVLFWISPRLAAIILLSAPVSAVAAMVVAKRAKPNLTRQWQATSSLSGSFEEELTARQMLKAYEADDLVRERFTTLNDTLFSSMRSAQWTAGTLAPALTCMNAIVYLILAVVGGVQVINGDLSLGAAQVVVVFASQLAGSVKELAGFLPRIQSGAVSAGQVRDLLQTPAESDPAVDAAELPVSPEGPPRIEFDNVGFGYDPGARVLHEVSFSMPPGTTTAIVGTTGSGKTTLTSLLQCFYTPDSGSIRINGTDVTDLGRAGTRSMIAAVAQEPWLFTGSVGDNVAYGLRETDDQSDAGARELALAEAIVDSHVGQIVSVLPEGLDTTVGNDGGNLSAGELQLVTVARAIAAQPRILVLDEATSSADPRTELLIQRALLRLRSRTTTLLVTHRLATAALADQIVVLEGGRVVECGTHRDLIAAGGSYAQRCERDRQEDVSDVASRTRGARRASYDETPTQVLGRINTTVPWE